MRGRTLTQLAQELEAIEKGREDILASPATLRMAESGLIRAGEFAYNPTSWAHQQIATYLDIPKFYYDRLLASDYDLLAHNVNHWMQKQDKEERRLLRTVNGKMRGFLSSRYRVIDSYDLVSTVLPILRDKGFQIAQCELTDKRLYIKAVLPKVSAEVKPGDVVQFGVLITNSEVGAGSFRIEPFLMRLLCMNGAITDAAIKVFHTGKNNAGDAMLEVLSDEALKADDEALMLKVRDILLASSDPEKLFKAQVEAMKHAASNPIKNYDLIEVVKKATTRVGITSKLIRENIVAQLANGNEGAGLTQWGLVNSFTAAAKLEAIGYDESVDLERAGGTILTLDPKQWQEIAS